MERPRFTGLFLCLNIFSYRVKSILFIFQGVSDICQDI